MNMKNIIALSPYLIIVALVVFLLGMWTGYDWRDTIAEADQAKAVKFALKKQAENNAISRTEEMALIKSQQKTKVVYRSIAKEAPKYVSATQKNDSACNVSNGSLRLFDRAVSERMPEATTVIDPRDTEPSNVTEERLINYSLSNIETFNKVKNQCNGLIRWAKKIAENNANKGN